MVNEEVLMSKDEKVNGAAIAAAILSKMDTTVQTRIVRKMRQIDPVLTTKVEENIVTFESLSHLSNKSAQLLLQHVSPQELALSLKNASPEVKEHLVSNLTERKRDQVKEELMHLPALRLQEVEAAQRTILVKLEELEQAGLLRTKGKGVYV